MLIGPVMTCGVRRQHSAIAGTPTIPVHDARLRFGFEQRGGLPLGTGRDCAGAEDRLHLPQLRQTDGRADGRQGCAGGSAPAAVGQQKPDHQHTDHVASVKENEAALRHKVQQQAGIVKAEVVNHPEQGILGGMSSLCDVSLSL
jgi:hypothetical protein